MKNNKKEGLSFPRLYTLHSQKGGVGKTSIALAVAGFSSVFHKKKTLIIDADLTGSSLADIPGWWSGNKVTYFNELILARPRDFDRYTNLNPSSSHESSMDKINEFYQEHPDPEYKGLFYFPSSPFFADIQRVIPLITQEDHLHFFKNRLEDIIGRVLLDSFEVIIIDHPPGLFGVSKASLNMVLNQAIDPSGSRLNRLAKTANKKPFTTQALLITSSDSVDYKASLPSLSWIIENEEYEQNIKFIDKFNVTGKSQKQIIIPVDLILNKGMMSSDMGAFDPLFAFTKMLDDLGKNKFPDDRRMHPIILEHLRDRARKLGALAARYNPTFQMNEILDVIKTLYGQKRINIDYTQMEGWCREIGKSIGFYSDDISLSDKVKNA